MRKTKIKLYYKDCINSSISYVQEIVNLIENETIILYSDKAEKCVLIGQRGNKSIKCEDVSLEMVLDTIRYDELGLLSLLNYCGYSKRYKMVNMTDKEIDVANTFVSKVDNIGYEVVLRRGKKPYFEISKVYCEKLEDFSGSKIQKIFL